MRLYAGHPIGVDVKHTLDGQFRMCANGAHINVKNKPTAYEGDKIEKNDRDLRKSITDVESVGRDFGLAMMGSAEILADSIATVAKLSLNEED